MKHGDQQASIQGQGGADLGNLWNVGTIPVNPDLQRDLERIADRLQPEQRDLIAQGVLAYGVAFGRRIEELCRTAARDDVRGEARLDIAHLALTVAQRVLPGLVTQNTRYAGLGADAGAGGTAATESRR
jgi:hypothetical protein